MASPRKQLLMFARLTAIYAGKVMLSKTALTDMFIAD
jgi:hypothetical protein